MRIVSIAVALLVALPAGAQTNHPSDVDLSPHPIRASAMGTPEPGTPTTLPSQKNIHTLAMPVTRARRAQDLFALHTVAATAAKAEAQYRHDGQAPLNDLKVTPGALDPALTEARLCNPKFHTGTVRNVTESTKKKVCAEYGQKGCPSHDFEIDHLISIELGGSNDIKNLWPQPVDAAGVIGFHTKDVLENQLHKMVCTGTISLPQAQHCIATDWYGCKLQLDKIEAGN